MREYKARSCQGYVNSYFWTANHTIDYCTSRLLITHKQSKWQLQEEQLPKLGLCGGHVDRVINSYNDKLSDFNKQGLTAATGTRTASQQEVLWN